MDKNSKNRLGIIGLIFVIAGIVGAIVYFIQRQSDEDKD